MYRRLRRKRDRELVEKRLKLSKYKCEFDASHKLFIARATGCPCLEVHHIVPLMYEAHYKEKRLDSLGNLCCLCPNCHSAVHHAGEDYTREILAELSRKRSIQRHFGCVTVETFFDALNHYAMGGGADATIGDNIMMEFTSTGAYAQIESAAHTAVWVLPLNLQSGAYVVTGSALWEQGDILGRNVMSVHMQVEWTATPWLLVPNDYWFRTVRCCMTVALDTDDEWDFEVHEGDSILRSVFGEMIPEAIASLYSVLVSSNTGCEYKMYGHTVFTRNFERKQIKYVEKE